MWGISHCLLLLWSALWTTENYHSCFYKSLRVCVCVCMHVSLHMAQGPVCGVNRRRVNTQAACSLHCYYPVCIISLINCSHQRHCPLKYCWASFQVKENRVGRGSSGPSTETCSRHNGKRNLVQRCPVALLKKNFCFSNHGISGSIKQWKYESSSFFWSTSPSNNQLPSATSCQPVSQPDVASDFTDFSRPVWLGSNVESL